ncbi:MAG: YceH family protein [Pyrinomonadaceae bacterium]|nr:YceH family protein [Pyrinomonadaceae bacterium]
MLTQLTEIEARVVGCLVEKQLTTPEYYPLTLNALVNACNQKSNRDPVVNYDEKTVENALQSLRDKNVVYVFYGSSSRVPKYKHILPDVYDLSPAEVAALSVLMLRGPQTGGEINQRSSRLFEFSGLDEVNQTLERLADREEPLVARLERQPGQKESRYTHLLSGEISEEMLAAFQKSSSSSSAKDQRIAELEEEVQALRTEFETFRDSFEEFKKQFD